MLGPLIGLLSVILFSVRDVFFSEHFKVAPACTLVLIAFGTCSILFTMIALLERNKTFLVIKSNPRLFLEMNLYTALSWLCYCCALELTEPSIANAMFAGFGPLTLWIVRKPEAPRHRQRYSSFIEPGCHYAMLLILTYLAVVAMGGLSGRHIDGLWAILGCVSAVIAGITITISALSSKRLHEFGASAAAVVATRFLALLIAAGLGTYVGLTGDHLASTSLATLLEISASAILLMAIPIYLAQVGTKLMEPATTRVLSALAPVSTFIFQSIIGGLTPSKHTLIGIVAYSVVALVSAGLRLVNDAQQNRQSQTGLGPLELDSTRCAASEMAPGFRTG